MISVPSTEESSFRLLSSIRSGGPIVLCVLVGFLSAFTVPLVGHLPAGELILLLALPWVLIQVYAHRAWPTRFQQLGWYKLLLVLIGLMAFGYVASDLYRGTATTNLVRGWARVAFLALDLVTIAYLIQGSWRRLYVIVF